MGQFFGDSLCDPVLSKPLMIISLLFGGGHTNPETNVYEWALELIALTEY